MSVLVKRITIYQIVDIFCLQWYFISRPINSNCGYSLKVGMMGKCSSCDTKITNGDFDWVLSMIEQDESYTG